MADKINFAPLPGAGRPRRSPAPVADNWQPILPVPDDALPGPPIHKRRGKPTGCWTYRDAAERLLGYVQRFNLPGGGKEFLPATFCQNTTTGAREWRFKSWSAPRPLYGLRPLAARPTAPVVVTEGEKAADAAAKLLPDHVVVTSPNGAKGASKADWSVLRGRDVIIWPDNDDEGRAYAAAVAKALRGIAESIRIIGSTSGTPEKWDAADALTEGRDHAWAAALIAAAVPVDEDADTSNNSGSAGRRRKRQSDGLLAFLPEVELWHSPDREAFATVSVEGHFENRKVRGREFRLWLAGRYGEATNTVPSSQAMEDALRQYEYRAIYRGSEYEMFLRIGEHEGAIYIDLGDAQWRVIELTPSGWGSIDRAPVKFVRPPAMRALPMPEPGGLIEQELRDLINVRDDADFVLIVAWVVGCFNPRGPYPILIVNGEQGSAKSTLCRLLRRLIDPAEAEIRLPPRNVDDLIVAARNSHVLAFDNMSHLSDWLSDPLCSLATGTGFGTREHYSNTSEVNFRGARPIMLNGIPNLGDRADFADRSIHVLLQSIAKEHRRAESDYWRTVEARLPLIFGAILYAVARALRDRASAPQPVTRMADFELFVSAAEPALGWEPGTFLAAYIANREGAIEQALEADPLGDAVCQLVEHEDWGGTPTALLARLSEKVSDPERKLPTWPKAANKLRDRLRRLAPALRVKGIELDLGTPKAGGNRFIGIRRQGLIDAR